MEQLEFRFGWSWQNALPGRQPDDIDEPQFGDGGGQIRSLLWTGISKFGRCQIR
jgi:hypothetical protein